jgi:hypothetical protein
LLSDAAQPAINPLTIVGSRIAQREVQAPDVRVQADEKWTDADDQLRRLLWQPNDESAPVKDDFDDVSTHVRLFLGLDYVAHARLTFHPPSVLRAWSREDPDLPILPGYVDATRGGIHPAFRGRGFYEVLAYHLIRVAIERGADYLAATIEIENSYLYRTFERVGAKMSAKRFTFHPTNARPLVGGVFRLPLRAGSGVPEP